jgi:hypothetical protein
MVASYAVFCEIPRELAHLDRQHHTLLASHGAENFEL